MNSIVKLWRTTTVRLTALFILIFIIFSVGLLGYVGFQTSIEIQRVQAREVNWEVRQLRNLDRRGSLRALIFAVQRLASQPGPGIYYLGNAAGEMIAGNFPDVPSDVLAHPGHYTFSYSPVEAFGRSQRSNRDNPRRSGARRDSDVVPPPPRQAQAVVTSERLDSGLRLVVGRDIVQRRDFTQIIVRTLAYGLGGIVIFSALAGLLTARRVLRRIDTINATTRVIMAGNMSERVPVTRRNDEFDELASGLNDMLDRIEQLMQGLKEVTDNVAHDLKTPLTRLRNRAEAALREGRSDEDHRKALESTIAESDQLIATFNALLLIARIEAGSRTNALSNVNISEVVADICELYGPVIEDAGGMLEEDVEPLIFANANRELLSQALVNLLENAIKYGLKSGNGAPEGPDDAERRTIRVGVRRRGERIHIFVADRGPGIPEADRKRVLERFVRLEKSRTEPGSGLGLSLVSAVARLHRGTFALEDNHPGTHAVISLPEPGEENG